MVATFVLVLVC